MALYGCEVRTKGKGERRLEDLEVWCHRELLKIIWVDMVRNEEVLNLVKGRKMLILWTRI